MPVLTRERRQEIIDKLPTVKYPEEAVQRFNSEFLVAKAQMASGDKPMTVEEIAAEYGINLGELDDLDDED